MNDYEMRLRGVLRRLIVLRDEADLLLPDSDCAGYIGEAVHAALGALDSPLPEVEPPPVDYKQSECVEEAVLTHVWQFAKREWRAGNIVRSDCATDLLCQLEELFDGRDQPPPA